MIRLTKLGMETVLWMMLGLGPKPNGLPKKIIKQNNKEKTQIQESQPQWMTKIGILSMKIIMEERKAKASAAARKAAASFDALEIKGRSLRHDPTTHKDVKEKFSDHQEFFDQAQHRIGKAGSHHDGSTKTHVSALERIGTRWLKTGNKK